MRHTVVWLPGALATLANLWMDASDPQTVADASNRIDADLAKNPITGAQRYGDAFSKDEGPFRVLYEVDPGDLMVRVFAVKRI